MPWKDSTGDQKTWLPIPADHLAFSVENQERAADSVLHFVRKLAAWRKRHPWLNHASLVARAEGPQILVIERHSGEGQKISARIDLASFRFTVTGEVSAID